ncbi:hypothetical protein [Alkalihalobacillus sp. 1P02AB]|uniref:hypothetical protein n=1 Tax=Alkalihalobacillus sp. 1P02AB TaxID=3132260 RepID=UPI0039A6EC99
MCKNHYGSGSKWDNEPIRVEFDPFTRQYHPKGNSNVLGANMSKVLGVQGGKRPNLDCTELSFKYKEKESSGAFRALNIDYVECTPVADESDNDNDNGNNGWVCCKRVSPSV